MAEKGKLLRCVERVQHHADWTKLFTKIPADIERMKLIGEQLRKILQRVRKIDEAARSGDARTVLSVLDEEFEIE